MEASEGAAFIMGAICSIHPAIIRPYFSMMITFGK